MDTTNKNQDQGADVIPLNAQQAALINPALLTTFMLRMRLQELLDEGVSQTAAARHIGVSQTALSLWLKDKYTDVGGSDEKVTERVSRWMATCRLAQRPRANVATPSCTRIEDALTHAQRFGDMVAVTGSPGVGKSTVAKRYVTENPFSWLVTMTPATSGLIPALEAVAAALNVAEPVTGARRLSGAITNKVKEWKSCIIVDESQHLSMAAVEELRSIHDATGIGLALMGNETSYTRFLGGPRVAHYAQIRSRIGLKVLLTTPGREDVVAMLAGWGCSDDECVGPLVEIASRPGAMRNVTKALRWCVEHYGAVTLEGVLSACALIGPV